MTAGPTPFGITEFPNPEANKADLNQKAVVFHYFPLRYVLLIRVTKVKQIFCTCPVTKKILSRPYSNLTYVVLQLLLASPHPRYNKGSPAN